MRESRGTREAGSVLLLLGLLEEHVSLLLLLL
jgi:hypothetical protein